MYMNLTETRKKVVNDGISNFEHRQTAADDDEGMDLCKKKSLLQSATCIEGGGPPGSHHRFFFAHNSWSSRSKDQLSWACNNNDIIEEYNTKEADQLS